MIGPGSESGAGALRDRLAFQRRRLFDDGMGNQQAGDFETVLTVAARLMHLRGGGETVMAARLAGEQPYVIRIRSSRQAREIDPTWRIVDARDSKRVFNIKTIVDPDNRRAWLDITAIQGVAT